MRCVLAWFLFVAMGLAEELRSWNEIVSREVTYRSVKVLKVEPDGLRVMHETGVCKIRIEDLPEGLRAEFGLTMHEAMAFREREAQRKMNNVIAKGTLESGVKTQAQKEKSRQTSPLNYHYMVLKVERVLQNGDLLCYRHQDGGVAGSSAWIINQILNHSPKRNYVHGYTEYDKPYYLTGVPKKFGEGEIIRGKAAKAGIREYDGRTMVWLVAQ